MGLSWWDGAHWLLRPYAFFAGRGPTSWARLPGLGRVLITGQSELVNQLAGHPDLVGGQAHRALRAVLGDDHLIVLWGESHRRRRRALLAALHGVCDDALVEETTRECLRPGPVDLYDLMHEISLKVMLRLLVGRSPAGLLDQVRQFQRSFSNPLNLFVPCLRRDLGGWSPWGRLLARRTALVNRLMQELNGATPLSAALTEQLEPSSLPGEALALLMFGHETTAAALAWALAHLRQHPAAREPIRRGDQAYTRAFLEESLRLRPPVAQLTRVARRDTELGHHRLAALTTVMPSIWLSHQDPQVFPRPDRFCPERFLGQTPSPFAYYPFGVGHRVCPGKALALRQMAVTLQTILGSWNLSFEPDCRTRPVRRLFLVLPDRIRGAISAAQ